MGLREKKAARTRGQILDAAAELFLSQGYDETTMEQIAESADIAPSTLYRYFPSKDLLLLGRLTESLQLGDALRERPAGEPVAEALAATLLATIESFDDTPRFAELRHVIDVSPVPRARLWDVFMQSRSELEKELGVRMGLPEDDLQVMMTARSAITIFEIVAERWWAGDHTASRADVLDDVLRGLDATGVVFPASKTASRPKSVA
ncbi:TetR/AcrR family transcriptional regulator [Leifsonia aquatica]|uniref:TetR/AcrR family transcriptional regulator n=1 Tax=Leifsonia aquatica TaxID=144185 RepID=UPI000468DBAB|nr:TetR/AcrR family transcriptional regulator [Leifsonia aquatica]